MPLDLVRNELFGPESEKFKTHKHGGGPDRTRTYDPALIKRML